MDAARTDLALHRIPGVGPVKLRRLAEHFGDLSLAWRAAPSALAAAGLDPRAVEAVLAHRPRLEAAALREAVAALGVQVLTCLDPQYPERLRVVPGAPALLFIKGALQPADDWALAVVGTRHPAAYGRQVTQRLVTALVGHGSTIVSGLAWGIDAEAHQAALQAGGRTLVVLGCLATGIVEHGALLSALPLGASPEAGNFPARNRIISGLSRGVLVVEAGERSGALISATCAAEQGREVFAVPGSIFSPKSQGTHRLIQQGATLVQSAQDILEALNTGPVGTQLALRALLPQTRPRDSCWRSWDRSRCTSTRSCGPAAGRRPRWERCSPPSSSRGWSATWAASTTPAPARPFFDARNPFFNIRP